MEKENSIIKMEAYMTDNGLKTRCMEKEFFIMPLENLLMMGE
jgi:hypothetical protein